VQLAEEEREEAAGAAGDFILRSAYVLEFAAMGTEYSASCLFAAGAGLKCR